MPWNSHTHVDTLNVLKHVYCQLTNSSNTRVVLPLWGALFPSAHPVKNPSLYQPNLKWYESIGIWKMVYSNITNSRTEWHSHLTSTSEDKSRILARVFPNDCRERFNPSLCPATPRVRCTDWKQFTYLHHLYDECRTIIHKASTAQYLQ